jgi:tetratricopeptide (TPR) repeat protein
MTKEERARQARLNLAGLRLRSKTDLEAAEALIWQVFRSHLSVGFEDAFETLITMLPSVANARYGQAHRVKLLIHEKLAWFALQLNRIDASLGHARTAMESALEAFRESAGNKEYLLRYGEASLVASICLQKMHLPEESLKYIRAADEANEAAGQLPGSEHLRQRGTAFIQMGSRYDDLADKLLRLASERMEIKNEADHPVDLLMTGLRRRAFLDPEWGWEKSLDLVKAIENCYGKNSMQRAVAAKSAAAVGMKLADPKINETALALLEGTEQASLTPGILTQILSITPYLRLTGDDLDRWLRFAFHETPSQKR